MKYVGTDTRHSQTYITKCGDQLHTDALVGLNAHFVKRIVEIVNGEIHLRIRQLVLDALRWTQLSIFKHIGFVGIP